MGILRIQYGLHLAAILNIQFVFRFFSMLNFKLPIVPDHLCFRRYVALYIRKWFY